MLYTGVCYLQVLLDRSYMYCAMLVVYNVIYIEVLSYISSSLTLLL